MTAGGGDERDGCLVGFTTQCSIDPPLFLVCISVKNRTHRIAEGADHLVVHVVPEERRDLAELFGGETADETRQAQPGRLAARARGSADRGGLATGSRAGS